MFILQAIKNFFIDPSTFVILFIMLVMFFDGLTFRDFPFFDYFKEGDHKAKNRTSIPLNGRKIVRHR